MTPPDAAYEAIEETRKLRMTSETEARHLKGVITLWKQGKIQSPDHGKSL